MSRKTRRYMNSRRKNDVNQDNSWIGCTAIAVVLFVVAVLGVLTMLAGCSPKISPGSEFVKEVHDTTTLIQTERYDSLIFVPIPLEKNQVIVSVGDTSRLETSVAWSMAFVDRNGRLHHALENRSDKTLSAVVSIPSKTIWTNVNNSKFEQLRPPTVYIEKELSWWQKFRIDAFWWLVCGLAICFLWIFRKPMLKLFGVLI